MVLDLGNCTVPYKQHSIYRSNSWGWKVRLVPPCEAEYLVALLIDHTVLESVPDLLLSVVDLVALEINSSGRFEVLVSTIHAITKMQEKEKNKCTIFFKKLVC